MPPPRAPQAPLDPKDFNFASPAGVLKRSLQIIPRQTQFVLAGVIVFAGAAVVLGWMRGYSINLTVSVLFLILFAGFLATALSHVPARAYTGVGGFLAWAFSVLLVAVLFLILTSIFFGWPGPGAALAARLLGTEILTSLPSSAAPITLPTDEVRLVSNLPPIARDEPDGLDRVKQVQILASRPELLLKGTLEMAAGEKRVLVASTLNLQGGTITTNGGDLTIIVNNLRSDNGTIRAFANPSASSPGQAGKSGGHVGLVVYGAITGRLAVDLQGQNGADGTPGTNGKAGSKGAGGANGASSAVDCKRGPEKGKTGGSGTPGMDGGQGYAGGAGGVLVIQTANVDAVQRVIGTPQLDGGLGGSGGQGGTGGPGGPGGDGGGPNGWCHGNGPQGDQGAPGGNGKTGPKAADGTSGSFHVEQIASS